MTRKCHPRVPVRDVAFTQPCTLVCVVYLALDCVNVNGVVMCHDPPCGVLGMAVAALAIPGAAATVRIATRAASTLNRADSLAADMVSVRAQAITGLTF